MEHNFNIPTSLHEEMGHGNSVAEPIDADALFDKACNLALGKGVEANLERALEFASKAAQAGHNGAANLADDITRTLHNRQYSYFVLIDVGHVARYVPEKKAFVIKRCFDCTESINNTHVKAYEETDFDEEILADPWQLGNRYLIISEELYNDFGEHWALKPIEGNIIIDDVAAGQFEACGIKREQNKEFFTVESKEQIQEDLLTIQKPDDIIVGQFDAACRGVMDADGLINLSRCLEYGSYGLKSAAECPDNHKVSIQWLLYAASIDYDKAVRELYRIKYFQNRLDERIRNPEPVNNEADIIALTEKMNADKTFALANQYGIGDGVPRNYQFCASLLEIAASKGSAEAEYNLALLRTFRYIGNANDPLTDLIDQFQKAFDMGYKPAAKELREIFMNYSIDLDEIGKYIKLSAENGNIEDKLMYFTYRRLLDSASDEASPKDCNKILKEIQELPQDNADVLSYIGGLYQSGSCGLPVDYDKAWECYERAANMQDVSDENIVVKRLTESIPFATTGIGLEYDFPQIKDPFRGDGSSMTSMAGMILNGQHGNLERDREKAYELISKAFDRLDPKAIMLTEAIDSDDDEKTKRIINLDLNKEELQEFISLNLSVGDSTIASFYTLYKNMQEAYEQAQASEAESEEL